MRDHKYTSQSVCHKCHGRSSCRDKQPIRREHHGSHGHKHTFPKSCHKSHVHHNLSCTQLMSSQPLRKVLQVGVCNNKYRRWLSRLTLAVASAVETLPTSVTVAWAPWIKTLLPRVVSITYTARVVQPQFTLPQCDVPVTTSADTIAIAIVLASLN